MQSFWILIMLVRASMIDICYTRDKSIYLARATFVRRSPKMTRGVWCAMGSICQTQLSSKGCAASVLGGSQGMCHVGKKFWRDGKVNNMVTWLRPSRDVISTRPSPYLNNISYPFLLSVLSLKHLFPSHCPASARPSSSVRSPNWCARNRPSRWRSSVDGILRNVQWKRPWKWRSATLRNTIQHFRLSSNCISYQKI